jgi:hypothetical protein
MYKCVTLGARGLTGECAPMSMGRSRGERTPMALTKCQDCGHEVSSLAPACPKCGRPLAQRETATPKRKGTWCPNCGQDVVPAVTSVGGGTCTVGSRETWKCPSCKRVLYRSGCFVATVTYGDEDIVEVRFLRAFRDCVLAPSRFGRFLIWLYYRCGPYLGWLVLHTPFAKKTARRSLDFFVTAIEHLTNLRRDHFRAR